MKCKNKEIIVQGSFYINGYNKLSVGSLRCICTNDEKGKTLSIDNGFMQFSIPFEPIEEYLKGDYCK